MDEEHLKELLQAAGSRYRVPPEPPLDRMWARIEARAFGAEAIRLRPAARWARPLAYAAMLVLGVGIGFVAARSGVAPGPSGTELAVEPASDDAATPFVGVASDYLEHATALMIAVASDLRTSGVVPAGTVTRAEDLLSTTRLLLDNAPADPTLQTMLEDLELVLAQVVRLPPSTTAPDAALIRQTLDQREVLPRLTVMLADARITP